ncbi:MAG: hypothetical protein QXE32_04615 [Sulfolobales archaeon]
MEVNIVKKNPMRVGLRIAFIYPSLYQVMISSLATDTIYHLVNSRDEVYLERFHAERLQGREFDPRSIETGSPLRDFHLYITSIHYEPDIVNLLSILDAGGIPLFRNVRETPIIAGGPGIMANPIPFEDIIDAFVIGEAENTLDKIIDLRLEYVDNKKRFLEELSKLEYVYVPGYSEERVIRRYVQDLDRSFYPIRQIENIEIEPVFGRGFKLEISRGCKFWCSFCMESRLTQPYRERSYETLKRILEEGSRYTISGRRVVIYSLLTPSSVNQVRFLEYLAGEGYIASIPSIRLNDLYLFSLDLLEIIKRLGQRTVTIAPESFSFKVRRGFFKYLESSELLERRIIEILDKGFDLKIYMIYGVKWEKEDDVKANIEALRRIARHARERNKRISLSLNPLIPKPKTVFQWIGMSDRERLRKILDVYRRELRGLIDTRPLDIEWSIVQAVIALSPKPLGRILAEWSRSGRKISYFMRIIREIDTRYVFEGYRYGEDLPWDRIYLGSMVEETTARQYEVIRDHLHYI